MDCFARLFSYFEAFQAGDGYDRVVGCEEE